MDEPAREGKYEGMLAVAAPPALHQQHLAVGQPAPAGLDLQERQHGLELAGRRRSGPRRVADEVEHGVGKERGERHPAAVPAGHLQRGGGSRPFHPGGQAVEPEEHERPAREQNPIALLQAGDERLLDGAQASAPQPLHLHGRVAGDRADAHPVFAGQCRAGDVPAAEPLLDPRVVGIGGERGPATAGEIHRPPPRRVVEVREGAGRADLRQEIRLAEAAAAGDGDDVLGEAVERGLERLAGLHRAPLAGAAGGGAFDQLERVGGHADEPAGRPRGMAAAAGPLEQPGDPLGAADLKHLVDRTEVDAEVETRRGDHTLHPAPLQPLLGGRAELAIDRAVVEGEPLLPLGPRLTDRVEPALGL